MLDCLLAGMGGQGTVLASKLIADAALAEGCYVRTSETIGMAQRGGSVLSHVRISESEVFSPLLYNGSADLIIAFEPAEGVRAFPFLKKRGNMLLYDSFFSGVYYDKKVMLDFLSERLENLVVISGGQLEAISPKTVNVALVGAAVRRGWFPFSLSSFEHVLRERIPPKFIDMNIKALSLEN